MKQRPLARLSIISWLVKLSLGQFLGSNCFCYLISLKGFRGGFDGKGFWNLGSKFLGLSGLKEMVGSFVGGKKSGS